MLTKSWDYCFNFFFFNFFFSARVDIRFQNGQLRTLARTGTLAT